MEALVEPGFQFLAVGVVDGGGKALDQTLEFDVAQVELHRSVRLLDPGVRNLGPEDQRVLEKLRLALRKAKPMAFLRDMDHGGNCQSPRMTTQAARLRRRVFRAIAPAPITAITQVEGSGTTASRPEAGLKARYCPLEVSGVYQLPLGLYRNVIPE